MSTDHKETVAIFVDVQNIYYTCRDAYQRHFDYNQWWAAATHSLEVVSAKAYTTTSQDPKRRQFHHILRGIGFEVMLKPFIQRRDGSAKGDWDVGITLDVIEIAPHVDRVILVSGDGDFQLLVERIQQKYGTHVTVYGVPQNTAQALIESADQFVNIDNKFLL